MRGRILQIITGLLFVALLAFPHLAIALAQDQSSQQYMVFSRDVGFRIPAHDTYISFTSNYSCTAIEWDDINATAVFFYNFSVPAGEGDEVSKIGFSIINGNLTIIKLEHRVLHLTATGRSGTFAYVIIYCPEEYGKPARIKVDEEVLKEVSYDLLVGTQYHCWYFDEEGNVLYIKVRFSSPAHIVVSWREVPAYPAEAAFPTEWVIIIVIMIAAIAVAVVVFIRKRKSKFFLHPLC